MNVLLNNQPRNVKKTFRGWIVLCKQLVQGYYVLNSRTMFVFGKSISRFFTIFAEIR